MKQFSMETSCSRKAAEIILVAGRAKNEASGDLFLSSSERNTLPVACKQVKRMIDWNFKFEEFYDILFKIPLRLETLWYLHVFQILSLEIYLLKVSQAFFLKEELKKRIFELFLADTEGDSPSNFVQTGVMSYLVKKAFGEANEEVKEICVTIVNSVLANIFAREKQCIFQERMIPLTQIWYSGIIEKSTLHAFCKYTLHKFVKLPGATVMDVFPIQESIKNEINSFPQHILIQKIISTLEGNQMQELLSDAAFESDTNWKNYLITIDLFMITHSQASVIISGLTSELMKDGFQNQDYLCLLKVLVLGRQVALCSDGSFSIGYKQWFQAQFSNCILLKIPDNFSFFLQVLSDLIPHEKNIDIIKVSLNRSLHVPPGCHSVHADYLALLKTRIKDLEPHVEPEEVLKKLLMAFQETGKIPPYILEASLMRKHYFLNEFLPILLAPRVVPRIPDVQERFIQELDRAVKIPPIILQKYRTACLEEERKLVAGINAAEDNFMEDL